MWSKLKVYPANNCESQPGYFPSIQGRAERIIHAQIPSHPPDPFHRRIEITKPQLQEFFKVEFLKLFSKYALIKKFPG